MVELETINSLVQIVGVSATAIAAVVGVSSYINSNKRAEEAKRKEQDTRDRELDTRQAQMFLNIYDQTKTRDFQSAFIRVIPKARWSNFKEYRELNKDLEFQVACNTLMMLYEGLGVLVRKGLLHIRMIALLMCGSTRLYWSKYSQIAEEARSVMGYTRFLS
ncbi:MAG: hypothetical protein NTY03_08745 [Candidatus Bathyarchaeota archaeon]|nr:hypothetical protein [Candidatus Bathyarchaeota archaeon]